MNISCFKVKIGQEEHISQLQKEGVVYCNTLKYFTEFEDGQVRGDKHEDAFEFKTFRNPELLIKPVNEPDAKFKKVDITWSQIVKRNSNPYGNLYCLYCVDMSKAENEGQINVNEKNREFGSHALILLNAKKFEERLYSELKKRKMKFHFGFVHYVDLRNHTGKKSLFEKDLKYSYQNEFRIFIENEIQEPLILKIGDISDISSCCEFDTFKQLKYKRP
jgi:hypothetical protein